MEVVSEHVVSKDIFIEKAKIEQSSSASYHPSGIDVLKHDLHLVEKYVEALFKHIFGSVSTSVYTKDFKKCVKIAKAEYLHDNQTPEAEMLLDMESLRKYIGTNPSYPYFPLVSNEEIIDVNLKQLERFYKAHFKFVLGNGGDGSPECHQKIYEMKVRYLLESEYKEAEKFLEGLEEAKGQ